MLTPALMLRAGSAANSGRSRRRTAPQSPGACCRYKQALGYQGLSERYFSLTPQPVVKPQSELRNCSPRRHFRQEERQHAR